MIGEKGSGKSLLSKQVCMASGLPVILINNDYSGDSFNSFLTSITQPCIVFFDEFEKTYDRDAQKNILTLLDGTFNSNKLFLFTCNDKYSLDDNLYNRPGRIYYMLEFGGVDEEFIREYCEENLKNKYMINKIIDLAKGFAVFNFDILAAFVEEMNRYNEDPNDLITILNAKPRRFGDSHYDTVIKIGEYKTNGFSMRNLNITDETVMIRLSLRTHSEELVEMLSNKEDLDLLVESINNKQVWVPSKKEKVHSKIEEFLNKEDNDSEDDSEEIVYELMTTINLSPKFMEYNSELKGYIYYPHKHITVEAIPNMHSGGNNMEYYF